MVSSDSLRSLLADAAEEVVAHHSPRVRFGCERGCAEVWAQFERRLGRSFP